MQLTPSIERLRAALVEADEHDSPLACELTLMASVREHYVGAHPPNMAEVKKQTREALEKATLAAISIRPWKEQIRNKEEVLANAFARTEQQIERDRATAFYLRSRSQGLLEQPKLLAAAEVLEKLASRAQTANNEGNLLLGVMLSGTIGRGEKTEDAVQRAFAIQLGFLWFDLTGVPPNSTRGKTRDPFHAFLVEAADCAFISSTSLETGIVDGTTGDKRWKRCAQKIARSLRGLPPANK